MADDLFGAQDKPVPSHPVNRIVEFQDPLATVGILRTGERNGPYHWPTTFQRVLPVKPNPGNSTRLGYKRPWLGRTDGVFTPGDPQYAIDILPQPVRADVPVDFDAGEVPNEGRYRFPPSELAKPIPQATPSGAGTLSFDDMYCWFVGWAGDTQDVPGTDNLIINLIKLRRDFARRETGGDGKVKVTPPTQVQFQFLNGLRRGEPTGPADQFYITFEVYGGGDRNFLLDTRANALYGSGRLIASKSVKVTTTNVMHTVKYTFKDRKIEFTGIV